MTRRCLSMAVLWCFGVLFAPCSGAGQSSDNNTAGGLTVAVDLRHRIVVPQILYFRIGDATPGVVNKLQFNAAPGGAGNGNNQTYSLGEPVPFGDSSPIAAVGGGALRVQIESNVGDVSLSYELSDPLGLSDGSGNHIPFDEIVVTSADPLGLPTPMLTNLGASGAVAVPITGNLHGGKVIRRQTEWTYTYKNSQIVSAGTYEGRVRYTVASP